MGFSTKMYMDYGVLEMYGFFIFSSANQHGKSKNVWIIQNYGI